MFIFKNSTHVYLIVNNDNIRFVNVCCLIRRNHICVYIEKELAQKFNIYDLVGAPYKFDIFPFNILDKNNLIDLIYQLNELKLNNKYDVIEIHTCLNILNICLFN